ncbi:hypothetical protein [Corynebacterium sp. 239_CJEI]|uniref:hypothetical protein n=1 Tax=Corynebacterium sp. 239_CJEI TaxID=2715674 RepID=UPI000667F393|nr:hypothetical protein [Corynebacterium sp. 239_CJEI]
MTTVFVDLVNLDGSRPEGTLRFSLERLVLGDPDIVPSAVEVKIRDGKARVENLLPGAMRVRVNAGCWSKDWQVTIPAEGEHDLLDLLEWQADEFQETVWAELAKRVEALENTPAVDLAPLEDATRDLGNRVTVLEGKPDPKPFDPTELKTQLAELRAHFTPVNLAWLDGPGDDLDPIWSTGATPSVVQHAGRVNIDILVTADIEGTLRALDGLQLPHFPKVSAFSGDSVSFASVRLYARAKFPEELDPAAIHLNSRSGILSFRVALDDVLAVVKETGSNRMTLSTFYYTNDLPPETTD